MWQERARQLDRDVEAMTNPYTGKQSEWLNGLQKRYRSVANGICMAGTTGPGEAPTEKCEGPIGYRHAISERHVRLIADGGNMIGANKESGSFAVWSEQREALQRVPVSRFIAGKWACQRHDERFAGIDANRIDLSDPENLFKAVYRVVLRQAAKIPDINCPCAASVSANPPSRPACPTPEGDNRCDG